MNILITGGTSGIGLALVNHYLETGADKIFVCGRSKERVDETQKLSKKISAETLDVTKREDVKKWIESCDKEAELDLVIVNAGVDTLAEAPKNIFNTFDVNVNGVINTVVPTVEIFKKRKSGQIALVSSLAGYHGLPSAPSYSAGKACVKAYGEALRGSLKDYGIKVSVICPGFVRSRITDRNAFHMPFFMEANKAAEIIGKGLKKNKGIIAFPWEMRLVVWLISIIPNCISDWVYNRLPKKSS